MLKGGAELEIIGETMEKQPDFDTWLKNRFSETF